MPQWWVINNSSAIEQNRQKYSSMIMNICNINVLISIALP